MNQKTDKSSKLARCPYCHRLLCKRIFMHNENEEVCGLHIKHRGMEVWLAQSAAVFKCPACEKKTMIDSEKGVLKNG